MLAVTAFLVAVSQSFSTTVTAWTTYTAAVAVLFILAAAQLIGGRSTTQRLLDVPAAAIALCTGVTSMAYVGDTVRWLSLAGALGLGVCAVAGLAVQRQIALPRRFAWPT
jgi:hypothetical protein